MSSPGIFERKHIKNAVRKLKDFKAGDEIYCHGGKHRGELAQIISVGRRRLTVNFANGNHKGQYVDYTDATVLDSDGNPISKHAIPPRFWMAPSSDILTAEWDPEGNEDSSLEASTPAGETDQQLPELLEQLAIISGTAIR